MSIAEIMEPEFAEYFIDCYRDYRYSDTKLNFKQYLAVKHLLLKDGRNVLVITEDTDDLPDRAVLIGHYGELKSAYESQHKRKPEMPTYYLVSFAQYLAYHCMAEEQG